MPSHALIPFLLWLGGVLLGLTPLGAHAGPVVYREGCEYPFQGVSVCFEVSALEASDHAPFKELHLLPVAMERDGEAALLTDYTRMIYRQLLSARLARRLIQEWTPVLHLDQLVRDVDPTWPVTLWIDPRQLRNSSAASPGVVDWEIYFLRHDGELVRNLRIRVESAPEVTTATLEQAMLSAGFIYTTLGAGALATGEMLLIMGGSVLQAQESPPRAGLSLELLSQLALRQLIALMDRPIEEIVPGHGDRPGLWHPRFPKVVK